MLANKRFKQYAFRNLELLDRFQGILLESNGELLRLEGRNNRMRY